MRPPRFPSPSSSSRPSIGDKCCAPPMAPCFFTGDKLAKLGFRFYLTHHLPHRGRRTRRALLAPDFQPLAGLLDVLKKVRVLESRAPRGDDGPHAIPNYPDFAVTVEEKFVINQSAVYDPCHHVPITDYHADKGV